MPNKALNRKHLPPFRYAPLRQFFRRGWALGEKTMSVRELRTCPEIEGDPRAPEMIRFRLAHDPLHVSLLVGIWGDAEDFEIDEREAWGTPFARRSPRKTQRAILIKSAS